MTEQPRKVTCTVEHPNELDSVWNLAIEEEIPPDAKAPKPGTEVVTWMSDSGLIRRKP